MSNRNALRRRSAKRLALIGLLATSASAEAADINITDAKIAGGKLVVTGTTAAPNTAVRLDARTGADFNVRSKRDKSFSISVVYHPGDCIVSVQKVTPPATLGEAADALVANCGPRGLTPRGAWSQTAAYQSNDLVTHLGSSWRARRDNLGRSPVAGSDWEQFAAAGASGTAGAAGTTGSDGGSGSVAAKTPPTGPAGGDLTGSYPNPTIRADAVTSAKIAFGAVSSSDLASNSVNSLKIATGAVTNGKIANGAVTNFKIADGAVGANKLAASAVTAAKIATDAVTNAKIAGGAVGNAEIANGAVGNAKIAAAAVTNDKIATGAVTSLSVLDDIAGGGLNSEDINPLHGDIDIQDNTITTFDIASDAIDSDEVVDFGLSNQDIGVLFAEVNGDGSLAFSSGGVTSFKLGGTGAYEVDFGRDVTFCTHVGTVGPAGAGSAQGELNVADRAGVPNAVFVDTNFSNGDPADLPFRLVVVC